MTSLYFTVLSAIITLALAFEVKKLTKRTVLDPMMIQFTIQLLSDGLLSSVAGAFYVCLKLVEIFTFGSSFSSLIQLFGDTLSYSHLPSISAKEDSSSTEQVIMVHRIF